MSAEAENLCSSKIKSYNIYNEKDVKNIISNNNESNLTKVKQRFSKSSGNFDTQSGSDNVSRRCSKIVKSPIEIENKDKENDNLNTTSHFLINCSTRCAAFLALCRCRLRLRASRRFSAWCASRSSIVICGGGSIPCSRNR